MIMRFLQTNSEVKLNAKKFKIVTVLVLTLFSGTVSAHDCVLAGNTASEIYVYNSCKNDLATRKAGHDNENLKENAAALERENELLKRQLFWVREQLRKIFTEIK